MACSLAAPSLPVPDSTTPMARSPAPSANDLKNRLTLGLGTVSLGGSCRCSSPSSPSTTLLLGGVTSKVSGSGRQPSLTSPTVIGVVRPSSCAIMLRCVGDMCCTTTKPSPRPGNSAVSASSPPADDPMPTMYGSVSCVRRAAGRRGRRCQGRPQAGSRHWLSSVGHGHPEASGPTAWSPNRRRAQPGQMSWPSRAAGGRSVSAQSGWPSSRMRMHWLQRQAAVPAARRATQHGTAPAAAISGGGVPTVVQFDDAVVGIKHILHDVVPRLVSHRRQSLGRGFSVASLPPGWIRLLRHLAGESDSPRLVHLPMAVQPGSAVSPLCGAWVQRIRPFGMERKGGPRASTEGQLDQRTARPPEVDPVLRTLWHPEPSRAMCVRCP